MAWPSPRELCVCSFALLGFLLFPAVRGHSGAAGGPPWGFLKPSVLLSTHTGSTAETILGDPELLKRDIWIFVAMISSMIDENQFTLTL